ncbi:uncharacterized protein [Linepithema humile]|uniref:uncharacterized protein n=1 Tax=Linepithema humile TaxID=83485 RepID=UPI000623B140|nr:PREDICTED: uncharacterized protein LOC105668983 [Linepithema humile]
MDMEYTLEDALVLLQEKKRKQEKSIENFIKILSNNETFSLKTSSSLEDIKMKQKELHQNLLKQIQQIEPKDYPILRTSDSRLELITEIEKDIHDMQELFDNLQQKLSDIQEDITYLKNKKSGLDKMQEAYLDATNTFANTMYKKELIVSKRIFKEIKKDLANTVDIIFPKNVDLNDLLATLTAAYSKGGDDVYIDVTPDVLEFVHYLLEANIIQYHRNDKTKIKMIELL